MSDFRIGWLFPDTLFLHGERGNVLALARYAELSGFSHSITKIDFDTDGFDPMAYDVLFAAAGEISSFPDVCGWLAPYRDRLEEYIEEGHPLVAT
ncbi:MAG: cobalamin biosynthesis protein CobQ, partial [Lachnospiraceae bacterium]|nr:cobalamin biosynthesis protein CobQ [Lachnospiraceae bacterium]